MKIELDENNDIVQVETNYIGSGLGDGIYFYPMTINFSNHKGVFDPTMLGKSTLE